MDDNRHRSTYSMSSRSHFTTTRVACAAGLMVWLSSSNAWAQFLPLDPTQVVINEQGGVTSEDGLRIHLGNLGGIQVVRNGTGQYYGDVPVGPEGVNNGFFMAIGAEGAATVYGPQLDIEWQATPWTAVSQSEVTGQGTVEAPYRVVTVVTAGGFTFAQTVSYVAPRVYFDVRLTLLPPAGNNQNVRVYHWLDTYLSGGDFGAAFRQPDVGHPTVVGVARNGQYGLLIAGNRAWDAYFSGAYYVPGELMELGGALDNWLDTDPDTDNGIAAQWDMGTPSAPVTWTYRLASVQANVSTCGDGEVTGYEGCDDGDTDDNDGCSSICQVEVGFACTGTPSICEQCFQDVDCDDGDDCTTDTCSNNTCSHASATSGTECLTGVCNGVGSCVECMQDEDCGPEGPLCNTETNTCYCAVDLDCDDQNECTSEVCTQGQCAFTVLASDTACSIGHCNADQDAPSCICDTDEDCSDQNSCSVDTCAAGQCSYSYAAAGDACDTGVCSEDATPACVECFQDTHCPNVEPWCKTETAACVECLDDGHCDDQNECTLDGCENDVCSHELRTGSACVGGGVCSDDAAVCVECVTSANCPDERPLCNDHDCVECVLDADCDDGNDCTQDVCTAQACEYSALAPGSACTNGYCAGSDDPACVTCADSSDGAIDDGCDSELPVCLVVGNGATCVSCQVAGDASVDFGCGGQTPFCNEDAYPRTCVECRSTNDCTGDDTCDAEGRCVGSDAGADGGGTTDIVETTDAGAPAVSTTEVFIETTTSDVAQGHSTREVTEPELATSETPAPATDEPTTATVVTTDVTPTEVTPTDVVPTDVTPTEATPTQGTPTEVSAAATTSEQDLSAPLVTTDVADGTGDAGVVVNNLGGGADGCDCRVAGAGSPGGGASAAWLLALTGLLVSRRSRVRRL